MHEPDLATVGNKGEILPKRRLRKVSGINPGDKVVIHAKSGELIIRKILSFEELFNLSKIASYTTEEAEATINKEANTQMELAD